MSDDELRRRVRIAQELELRRGDPLLRVYAARTAAQLAFINSACRIDVAEGGNRTGKTESSICKGLLQARGLHPAIKWAPSRPGDGWRGWYSTVTYELFSAMGWIHFKNMLLYPGESVLKLPTRNIIAIGWHNKNPETPHYLKLRDTHGRVAEMWIKTYDQGVGTFQSGGVDWLGIDEECPDNIFQECRFRIVERSGQISVSATPILGVSWLANLRAEAEERRANVSHTRLSMVDNPAIPAAVIDEIRYELRNHPELLKLRLEGFPLAMASVVYHDQCFTAAHVCDPFDIPSDWTRRRVIDYGYHNTACGWFAVSKDETQGVLYRDYKGKDRTIEQNCEAINGLSGGERYADTWIDPATLGVEGSSGKRVIDIFAESGLDCSPADRGQIVAGIEEVWKLLGETQGRQQGSGYRVGANISREGAKAPKVRDPRALPRFRVFRGCTEFLAERRVYKWPDAREQSVRNAERDEKDGVKLNPVKREDHCMDMWRYWVTSGGMTWRPPPAAPLPPEGTKARKFYDIRMRNAK